ncbi:helix-turn-helix domain containing protein [Mycobacteroides abscessus]|nr:helix-turn-helix domain containing protein [Mycobacteroides abscessus]MDM2369210.1 helix-turn-helix domain containing protein [Mycobacteroides abscessus]MDM2374662.1 helix-turn-helix domain containing protein [Mycobacteroides abscessus]MDM2378973.1 helix-turn-helix domain containing protein [Mycobacteroides abscessus]MDM2394631.1 helix-turn-helix domain containing protein [Mycobacteroides abscessus]
MEDIGRTAGVSRATVYRYFPSREAVMSGSSFAPPSAISTASARGSRRTPTWAPRSSTSWNTRLRPRAAKRSSDCCSAATRN